MSVALLVITHNNIGEELLQTATTLLGSCPIPCNIFSIEITADIDKSAASLEILSQEIDQGQGVLVLTDMYGSTPSNLANLLRTNPSVRIVAGINLPMLIRVFNYPQLDLEELANKAVSGGHDGILLCESRKDS